MTDWLKREIHVLALHFGLCLNERKFRQELKRLGVESDVEFLKTWHSGATTHFFTNKARGSVSAIVCMRDPGKRQIEEVYALLVHEAVHIWQEHCSLIGEDSPSPEFEAYSVQHISLCLMDAYRRMAPKRKAA
jgi:hypothetical protein